VWTRTGALEVHSALVPTAMADFDQRCSLAVNTFENSDRNHVDRVKEMKKVQKMHCLMIFDLQVAFVDEAEKQLSSSLHYHYN
jgi:hypothetical protein